MVQIRTPWRCVAAAFALNGVLLGAWASRIPAVVAQHGLSEGDLGLLLLVMGLGALISFPLAGGMSDRLGAVRLTRWTALLYLGAMVLIGLAPSPLLLAGALFIFGFSHGAMDVTMNSWGSEVEKAMGRSVMVSFHAMWSLGAGLGAASGYAALQFGLGTGTHFLLVALATLVVLAPFLWLQWESARHSGASKAPAFALPKGPLILVGVLAMCAGLGEGSVTDWSAVYLREVIEVDEARATLGYTFFAITMVVFRLCADGIITRFGAVAVARTSGLLAALGVALVISADGLPVALAGFLLMGVGYAPLVPLAFSRAAADPHVSAGQGIASVATLGYGAMLMGPPAIGFMAEVTSLRLSFAVIGTGALLAMALAPVLVARKKRSVAA